MDNNLFLKKILAATKNRNLKWEKAPKNNDLKNFDYSSYYSENNGKYIAIQKYQEKTIEPDDGEEYYSTYYMLSICSRELNRIYDMGENDFNTAGASDLIRLYRLVERQANNIDETLDIFTSNLNDFEF